MEIYKPNIYHFETLDKLLESVAATIFDQAHGAVSEEGGARIAFAANEYPLKILEKLAKDSFFPWESTEIYQTDERIQDNKGIFGEQILKEVSAIKDEIKEVNLFEVDSGISEAIKRYEEKLKCLDGVLFDAVVLEINEDGGFASLFPDSEGLKHHDDKFALSVSNPLTVNETRLTLNIETILNAKRIFAFLIGENKEKVIDGIFDAQTKATDLPAKLLLAHPNFNIYQWFDEEKQDIVV